ncbi:YlbF family regulator [Calderihabitans maritimus]|uniref:UPF0342 protein KKC1_21480 n=1 Tax=Calderihabitans maritimus TaxID=1246530 RepID=A0A1Z5HU03_9FIRM|nr:YlbF family regulator [Calderihabitans maritimus]GAW93004.1 hypothetical protein Moth_0821 [Calderihabitans maritimus]
MLPYDKAYELAKALAQSEEYKNYLQAKEKLERDDKNLKMLQEFKRRQLAIQMAELAGQEVDEEQIEQVERLYEIISLNPVINEFLTAEYRFSRMMADIQNIINEAISAWFELEDKNDYIN